MASGQSTSKPSGRVDDEGFLAAGGEMGGYMRGLDWSATAVGPAGGWPQSLRTVVRVMLDSRYAMWMGWGPELTFFYNDAYARDTLGKKHPWALGKPAREVWAEIWPDVGPRIDRVLATGEATWDEGLLLFLERSGFPEETYHTFSYSPLYDDGGKIGGMLCVVTEETDRVIAQRRVGLLRDLAAGLASTKTQRDILEATARVLNETPSVPLSLMYLMEGEEAKLALATGVDGSRVGPDAGVWPVGTLGQMQDAMVVALPDGLRGLPRRFGPRSPEQALVIPIAQQGRAEAAGFFVAGLNPHRPFDETYRSFLKLLVGQISSALSSARAFEEERRRVEALAELDRAKTAFFSNVSHEFRTPLTLMLGPLRDTIAQENGRLPARAVEELTVVYRNGLRLLKLVNTLLDFSRIEAGRVQATFEPRELARYTADLASVFRSAIEKAGMRLTVDCPPLPAPVYVDPGMWEKVVLNLVANAFKFTLEGEIAVSLRPVEGAVELSVRDTGCGIPEHELPRVFERFHRVEGTKGRTHEGTGIGLALVQELVKLHGGTVTVRSKVNEGTEFRVRIPLGTAHLPADRVSAATGDGAWAHSAESSAAASPALFVEEVSRWVPDSAGDEMAATVEAGEAAASRPQPAEQKRARRPRILLADDNADMRDYLRRLLAPRYDVEGVSDGIAALAAIESRRPDLVVSDVMMPNLDGFGLLKRLRGGEKTSHIPVILLSARAGEEATLDGLAAGADDYLVKPFSARDLMGRVAALLERKRFERELATADSRLRIALAASHMAAWEWDIETDTLILSDSSAEVYGLPAGTSAYDSVRGSELIHPDDRKSHLQLMDDVVRELKGYQTQFRIIRPIDGRTAWIEERGFAFRDEQTGGVRITGVTIDVTDVKRAEVERERLLERERASREEAEESSRLKDEFLATLSHELRTPLAAILGWVHLLEKDSIDPTARAEAISVIGRNARAQAHLIEDLLDMSRIASGKLRIEVQRVEMSDVIAAAIESARPAADARQVKLTTVIDTVRTVVSGDPHRLQQVVWNLLSNAIKFTPKGGRVQVTLRRVNSHVELSVTDSGQGISAAFLPHVFERFRQENASTRRSVGGLGLGLAIVKQLVELHGGTVAAASPGEGKGATFTVTLPVVVAHVGNETGADTQRESDATILSLAGVKVLVIDDEPDARHLVRRVLERSEARVITAGSAREAIDLFAKMRPDVIVSDIGMPDLDGYQFMRMIRSLPREEGGQTPAAALTAYARPQDRRLALMAGYQSHVVKPADPAELVTVVASLAGRLGQGGE